MSTTTVASTKKLTNIPIHLTPGQTSGSFQMPISFPAEYIMLLNDTIATIAVCIGQPSSQSADAQIWTPGSYLSMPLIQETQIVTIFWTSESPIPVDNNLVQFYFSNVTIPLQGGKYGAAAESQDVNVSNTVTTEFATPQDTNVKSMPPLPPGGNNIGTVNAELTGPLVSDNGLKVDMGSSNITIQNANIDSVSSKTGTFNFHTNQNAVAVGNALPVGSYKTLLVEITGSSSGHTIAFMGEGTSGIQIPLMGTNVSTLQNATSTSGLNELWQFDVTGITTVLMSVTAVNNSSLTVNGTVVA